MRRLLLGLLLATVTLCAQEPTRAVALTIPAGTGPSAYVSVGTATPVGIVTPAAITGTNYTFLCKWTEEGTGIAANGVSVAHVNSAYVPFPTATYSLLLGCPYVAVKTDATEASARAVTLVYRTLTR